MTHPYNRVRREACGTCRHWTLTDPLPGIAMHKDKGFCWDQKREKRRAESCQRYEREPGSDDDL